jgi:ABC-type microcin C transport system permease subunit YejB
MILMVLGNECAPVNFA